MFSRAPEGGFVPEQSAETSGRTPMGENIQHGFEFVQTFCPTNLLCCMASSLLRLRKAPGSAAHGLHFQRIPVLTARHRQQQTA
jgi:hypothetical protein